MCEPLVSWQRKPEHALPPRMPSFRGPHFTQILTTRRVRMCSFCLRWPSLGGDRFLSGYRVVALGCHSTLLSTAVVFIGVRHPTLYALVWHDYIHASLAAIVVLLR